MAIDAFQGSSALQFSDVVPVGSSHALTVTVIVLIHCNLRIGGRTFLSGGTFP